LQPALTDTPPPVNASRIVLPWTRSRPSTETERNVRPSSPTEGADALGWVGTFVGGATGTAGLAAAGRAGVASVPGVCLGAGVDEGGGFDEGDGVAAAEQAATTAAIATSAVAIQIAVIIRLYMGFQTVVGPTGFRRRESGAALRLPPGD
jgi:hypothetical protein